MGPTFEKGCLLRVKGIGANARRNEIFETVSVAAPVRFVDYFPADGKPVDIATLRFKDAQGAEKAIEYFKANPTKMGDSKNPVELSKFTDEDEQKYFEALAEKMARSS